MIYKWQSIPPSSSPANCAPQLRNDDSFSRYQSEWTRMSPHVSAFSIWTLKRRSSISSTTSVASAISRASRSSMTSERAPLISSALLYIRSHSWSQFTRELVHDLHLRRQGPSKISFISQNHRIFSWFRFHLLPLFGNRQIRQRGSHGTAHRRAAGIICLADRLRTAQP